VYQRRDSGGILGLFVVGIIVLFIISFFVRIVSALFPLLAFLIFIAIFWSIIKSAIGGTRMGRNNRSSNTHTNTRRKQSNGRNTNERTKTKGPKEAIDVEYTVIDDEDGDKGQKKD